MSRPCNPILEELPSGIAGQIVDELDLISKIRVRKTCGNLRSAVDDSRLKFSTIFLCFSADKILLSFSQDDFPTKNQLMYSKHALGCQVKFEKKEKVIEGGDYLKCALADFTSLITSPKVVLKELVMANKPADETKSREYLEAFKSALRSTNNLLAVRDFHLISNCEQEDIVTLLSGLKPGILEEIVLSKEMSSLEGVNSMEQWKRAKRGCVEVENAPIDDFLHFETLNLKTQIHFSTENAKKVVEAALGHPGPFRSISISPKSLDSTIPDYISSIADNCFPVFGPSRIIKVNTAAEPREYLKFIPIPNTSSCLAVRWGRNNEFHVERLRREKKHVMDMEGNISAEYWLKSE